MSSARPAEPVFSPLDNRLGLLPGQFSPFLIQAIVRLGTALPFEQVPDLLAFLTGVHIAADTVRRITEGAGSAQVAVEERDLVLLERDLPEPPEGAAVQQVSADGAMVPLVEGQWAEVRTVAVGTLETDDGDGCVHAQDITYFSRLCSADAFIRQAALPLHERGLARSTTVVAVMDGASWLQEFIDAHCPHAIRVLDFPHAVEYLSKAAQAAFGAGSREASVWLDEWAPKLKASNPDAVLAAIRGLPMPDAEANAVREQVLGYLTKRRGQIAYAQFRAAGYPIGSGMVESANKLVVEARLKGSGMHWERRNVTPMLALRGIACSDRWEQAWPGIWQELHDQDTRRRRDHRAQRAERAREKQQATEHERTTDDPPSPARSRPLPPPMMIDGRPTRHHPWRRFRLPGSPLLPPAPKP